MRKLLRKKSGFTLVEILLVVLMIGILATVAIRSYINSSDTFSFLAQYKNIFSSIRMARSYAITNKDVNGTVPKSYGVKIEANKVTLFADDGDNLYQFDEVVAGPNAAKADTVIATKTYSLEDTPYSLSVWDSSSPNNELLEMPVLLFYDKNSANFSARYDGADTNTLLSKTDHRYLAVKLSEENGSSKYIVIFQVSGLAEEYDQLNDLN